MPKHASFERKTIAGQYVIVSKDLPGFQVSAATAAEAERAFPSLLAKYLELMSRERQETTVIESVKLKQVGRAGA